MAANGQADQFLANVRRGIFVSDLHLFSPRSIGQRTVAELSTLSSGSDCIVLGGDIFDFRWSRHGNHAATLAAARGWLKDLLTATSEAIIVYLPGNHDCHPEFLAMLDMLSRQESRFFWAEHFIQIGDCLFLHGDVLDAGGWQRLPAYRKKFHHELPQSNLAHRSYDVAVGMRIHKLVPFLRHQPSRTCHRLLSTVQELALRPDQPVRRIYFGHTHVPIHGLQVNDVQFFNPGASLRHMARHLLTFHIAPEPAG